MTRAASSGSRRGSVSIRRRDASVPGVSFRLAGCGQLASRLAEQAIFTNPQKTRHGRADVADHLKDFQLRSPGDSFRLNNMVGWGSYALAEWQWVHAEGNPGVSGYDVLTFDENGLISSILLFGNVEAQKLAWRRRDPVSLETTS